MHARCTIVTVGRLAELWSEHGSPDAVATEMLKRWPSEVQPKPAVRTLGNRIRDLDQGRPMWWERRPLALRRLAAVLRLDDDELAEVLRPTGDVLHPAALPIAALGSLRPLRVDRDDPCPGLPPEVLAPEQWTRHWWVCPDPWTRDLVEAWHRHRARTAIRRAPTWQDAKEILPWAGRVLLVLTDQHQPVVADLFDRPGLFLCVLAPCPAQHHPKRPTWTEIDSRPPSAWIAELVAWARARGHAGGGLRTRGTRLGEQLAASSGWFEDPRHALELCGLAEEIGELPAQVAEIARRHVQRLWRRPDPALAPRRAWLGDHGLTNLIALIEAALHQYGFFMPYRLRRPQWEALVPLDAHARDVETAHARLKKARTVDPGLRDDLLAALDPAPRHFVDDLITAGILVPSSDDTLQIDTPWLTKGLVDAAVEQIDRSPLTVWAERLIQPVLAHHAILKLAADWQDRRYQRIDDILSTPYVDSLPLQLAIDACLRGAGLARVLGAELPRERVALLWRHLPSILRSTREDALPASRFIGKADAWLLDDQGFALAAVLLSELLDPGQRGPFEPLWLPGLSRTTAWAILDPLDQLFRAQVERREDSDLLDGLLRLGSRWLDHCGEFGRAHSVQELLMPAWLVKHALEAPTRQVLKRLGSHHLSPHFPRVMRRYCVLQDLDFPAVMEACWRAWTPSAGSDHRHPWLWLARDLPNDAQLPWRHLPPDLIRQTYRADLSTRNAGLFPNAWRLFNRPQWEAWLDIIGEHEDLWHMDEAWRHMPEDVLFTALDRGLLERFDIDANEVVWSRMNTVLLAQLADLQRRRPATVWRLIRNAPDRYQETCVDLLIRWLQDEPSGDRAEAASAYLGDVVGRRSRFAPRAWAALQEAATGTRGY